MNYASSPRWLGRYALCRVWRRPCLGAFFTALGLTLIVPATRASATNDSPAPDPGAILVELEKLSEKGAAARAKTHQERLSLLREAEAGGPAASRLFEEALKAVEFEGRRDQPFPAWKSRQGDFLRSPQFQKAAQLHARYLSLSLRRARDHGDKATEEHATLSWNYALDLAATLNQRDFADGLQPATRTVLLEPVGTGVLARWLTAEPHLPAAETWESRPGALEGILNTNIRPIWRRTRDPRLLATWDLQLQTEERLATENQPARQAEIFARTAKPTLLFQRAQDLAVLGQPNRAIRETLQVVRQHPAHPDAPQWIDQLRQWLGAEPATASTPAKSVPD